MSAYLLETSEIVRIAESLSALAGGSIEVRSLARNLYNMNAAAIAVRYGDRSPRFVFEPSTAPVLVGEELAKELSRFLYQCNEGNVAERNLFKIVDRIRKILKGEREDVGSARAYAESAATFAEENGIDYSRALVLFNID